MGNKEDTEGEALGGNGGALGEQSGALGEQGGALGEQSGAPRRREVGAGVGERSGERAIENGCGGTLGFCEGMSSAGTVPTQMTTANKITLVRIALVPVFTALALGYGMGVRAGAPVEALRWWALAVFAVAGLSDALDGWVARRFNQRSELGVVLDPIADKGLLLAGVLALSFSPWENGLPAWFGVLVVARDILVLVGVAGVFALHGRVALHPGWTGKTATALQMGILILVMLQPSWLGVTVSRSGEGALLEGVRFFDVLVGVTSVFTLVSGFSYLGDGFAQACGGGGRLRWNRGGVDSRMKAG